MKKNDDVEDLAGPIGNFPAGVSVHDRQVAERYAPTVFR